MSTTEEPLRAEEPPSGAVFWILSAVGAALIGFGIYGIVHDATLTRPASFVKYLLGGLLVHDLVIAPAVILAGVVLRRVVPDRVRAPVQAALIVSAVLALVSIPVVGGYGRLATLPSALYSHHYARSLLILVAIVCAAGALGVLRAWRRG